MRNVIGIDMQFTMNKYSQRMLRVLMHWLYPAIGWSATPEIGVRTKPGIRRGRTAAHLHWQWEGQKLKGQFCWYPLVNVYVTMERSTIFHGKTHYTWPFSIAMLNYQRVSSISGEIHREEARTSYFHWTWQVISWGWPLQRFRWGRNGERSYRT